MWRSYRVRALGAPAPSRLPRACGQLPGATSFLAPLVRVENRDLVEGVDLLAEELRLLPSRRGRLTRHSKSRQESLVLMRRRLVGEGIPFDRLYPDLPSLVSLF